MGQNWCLSPKARPQMGMWREVGRQRGSHPSSPAEPGWNGVAGEAGPLAWELGWRTALPGLVAQPQCLAHSKVSHCFLSCSTEPGVGAGAGLTSCLVFHSKSSKGSLAS